MYQVDTISLKKIVLVVSMIILLIIGGVFLFNYVRDLKNLERTDAYGNTPLMNAVKIGDIDRVETLLNRGANVNTVDNEGYTPLLVALHSNDKFTAEILFENGAAVNLVDRQGNSPMILSLKSEFYDLSKSFINNGAEINTINNLGEHPLTISLQKGNEDIISFLMENGSDLVVMPMDQLTVGSIIRDIQVKWRFRDGPNYTGRNFKEDFLEWIVIAHNHFGEDTTLLITREIVAKHEFDSTYGLVGGRDSWHSSKIRNWLITFFYRRLSDDFKESIIPTKTVTGGLVIPDERVFLLSQVELNLGKRHIVGDHGEPIVFFDLPGTRTAYIDEHSWYYWTRSAEAYVDEEFVGEYYKSRYRVRYVAPGGEIVSEYPLMNVGGVRPATNVDSGKLVTTYQIDDNHVIVWGDLSLLKPYLN